MSNERLRGALVSAGLTPLDLAAALQVDPKTVERWIATGRVPHRRHRWETAQKLGVDAGYLWPDVDHTDVDQELLQLYPRRSEVPHELWRSLFESATEHIDLLAYSALFLPDGTYPSIAETLSKRARDGVQVRVLIGDPESPMVRRRGDEEGIGAGLPARASLTLAYLAPAIAHGVDVRLHETTLYASLYRFDDDLLANPHAYGEPASRSPVLHLRRTPGGHLFQHYLGSLDRVWSTARPVAPPTT
ncbi:MAG: XRE family transcriptional regulator [Motilibacteraceae bacterium]